MPKLDAGYLQDTQLNVRRLGGVINEYKARRARRVGPPRFPARTRVSNSKCHRRGSARDE